MSRRSRGIAQPGNSVWVLSWAKLVQPSWRCDSCTGVPRFLASSTCLNTKNVKIHSILLERQIQTSCFVRRQMGTHLPICMMPVFKNVVPGPIVPAAAQTELKAAPTGKQSARQETRAVPIPWGQIVVACQAHLQPVTLEPKEGREGRLEREQTKWLCRYLQGASPGWWEAREKTWTLEPLTKQDLKILLAVLVPSHRQAAALRCTAQHSPKAGWCGLSRGCCA